MSDPKACVVPDCQDRSWSVRERKRPMCRLHYDLWTQSSEGRAFIGIVNPFDTWLRRMAARDAQAAKRAT